MLYPLGSRGIVAAASAWHNSQKWGFEQEGAFEQLVVSYLEEHFWSLMGREGRAMSKLLRASEELKKVLFETALEDDQAGLKGFSQ